MDMQEVRPNTYGGTFDRLAERRADDAWVQQALTSPGVRILPIRDGALPVAETEGGLQLGWLQPDALDLAGAVPVLLGETVAGEPWFAVDASTTLPDEAAAGDGLRFVDLREVGGSLSASEAALCATARGLLSWHQAQRHCGGCGASTRPEAAGHRLRCDGCGAALHPHIEPAVITLVTDGGDRCVLGRSRRHPSGMHSCFAGFVEPGESLEAAAAREVHEEVGLDVNDVRYHSSQPWPFPAALMIGFTARATTFDIQIDDHEIREARWFSRDELLHSPEDDTLRLPRPDSVARRLVEDWMHGR